MIEIINSNVLEFNTDKKYHAIISDPPYGLAFMGKGWDSFRTPLQYQQWVTEWSSHLMQFLYPGAICAFFGGTRTYHRLATGLEDAGYEIFDSMIWTYATGFPKSYAIGKNIINDEKWKGYGTALKPAYEKIILVRKPNDETSNIYQQLIELRDKLWLMYNVSIVKSHLKSNQVDLNVVLNTVQWNVETITNIQENLLEVMDMSQLELAINTSWNIVSSWLNIWDVICTQMNTYTTKTKINQIIDLKILNCYLSQITPENIIKDSLIPLGLKLNVEIVENLLIVVKKNMNAIQTLFAVENVMSLVHSDYQGETDNQIPIVLCRKPLEKGGYVNSVLKYGTSGLNIDGGRIESETIRTIQGQSHNQQNGLMYSGKDQRDKQVFENNIGRFPANFGLICDCEKEPCECVQLELDNQSGNISGRPVKPENINKSGNGHNGLFAKSLVTTGYYDKGGASRFFYTAKASSKERELGLEGLEQLNDIRINAPRDSEGEKFSVRHNNHPTVKPIKLIEYLATLLLPPIENSNLLIPFSGVGSEIIGANLAGWNHITGVEIDENYVNIANKRLEYWSQYDSYEDAIGKKKLPIDIQLQLL